MTKVKITCIFLIINSYIYGQNDVKIQQQEKMLLGICPNETNDTSTSKLTSPLDEAAEGLLQEQDFGYYSKPIIWKMEQLDTLRKVMLLQLKDILSDRTEGLEAVEKQFERYLTIADQLWQMEVDLYIYDPTNEQRVTDDVIAYQLFVKYGFFSTHTRQLEISYLTLKKYSQSDYGDSLRFLDQLPPPSPLKEFDYRKEILNVPYWVWLTEFKKTEREYESQVSGMFCIDIDYQQCMLDKDKTLENCEQCMEATMLRLKRIADSVLYKVYRVAQKNYKYQKLLLKLERQLEEFRIAMKAQREIIYSVIEPTPENYLIVHAQELNMLKAHIAFLLEIRDID